MTAPTRRRWTLTVPVIALLVAGCSGSGSDTSTESSGGPAASQSTSSNNAVAPDTATTATPGDDEASTSRVYDTDLKVAKPVIPTDAAGFFGAEKVQEAVDLIVELIQSQTFNGDSITTEAGVDTDKWLDPIAALMTPSTRAAFERDAKAFLRDAKAEKYGSSKGSDNILALTFYGGLTDGSSGPDGKTITSEDPVFVDRNISRIETYLSETGGPLGVEVDAHATVRVTIDGEPMLWGPQKRSLRFGLERADGEWKINFYSGTFTLGKTRPEK